MDILDDMGVSKLSAKVFLKANYSFNASGNWQPVQFCEERSEVCSLGLLKTVWIEQISLDLLTYPASFIVSNTVDIETTLYTKYNPW